LQLPKKPKIAKKSPKTTTTKNSILRLSYQTDIIDLSPCNICWFTFNTPPTTLRIAINPRIFQPKCPHHHKTSITFLFSLLSHSPDFNSKDMLTRVFSSTMITMVCFKFFRYSQQNNSFFFFFFQDFNFLTLPHSTPSLRPFVFYPSISLLSLLKNMAHILHQLLMTTKIQCHCCNLQPAFVVQTLVLLA